MTVCEHCQYRYTWDCQDDYYRPKNGCEYFKLDFDTLTKKQQKAIRKILINEENCDEE